MKIFDIFKPKSASEPRSHHTMSRVEDEHIALLAREIVLECILNPEIHSQKTTTRLCALWKYDNTHDYGSSRRWNCRFVIAVMCDLDFPRKQKAAWALIRNSEQGDFDWTTESEYCVSTALKHLGLEPRQIPEEKVLHPEDCAELITRFNLPTTKYGRTEPLTQEEMELCDKLESFYQVQ